MKAKRQCLICDAPTAFTITVTDNSVPGNVIERILELCDCHYLDMETAMENQIDDMNDEAGHLKNGG